MVSSHVKVCSLIVACHMQLAEYGERPTDLCFLKLTLRFRQRLAHLPSSWLLSRAISLSRHLVEHGQTPHINLRPCGKHHGDNPTTSKITFDSIRD